MIQLPQINIDGASAAAEQSKNEPAALSGGESENSQAPVQEVLDPRILQPPSLPLPPVVHPRFELPPELDPKKVNPVTQLVDALKGLSQIAFWTIVSLVLGTGAFSICVISVLVIKWLIEVARETL